MQTHEPVAKRVIWEINIQTGHYLSKVVRPISSISTFLSRFARKSEHFYPKFGMAERSVFNSDYGALGVISENYRIV